MRLQESSGPFWTITNNYRGLYGHCDMLGTYSILSYVM